MKKTIVKIIKVSLFVGLLISLFVVAAAYNLSKIPIAPNNYTEIVKTGGELETKYLATGPREVSYMEYLALMSFEKYEIYYPSDMETIDGKLPVVIFVNGTGAVGSKYPALQKHMASWGFIVVATEEKHAWNGFSAEMSVRMLEKLNRLQGEYYGKNNMFYQKIDLDKIGVTGHSQGGYGVVNAITIQKHKENYKAAVILSSTPSMVENDFLWEADPSLIDVPTLILGSTGRIDSAIASLEGLQNLYANIPNGVTKVLARRKGVDHGEMSYYADGYATAWFRWHLYGDKDAYNAVLGKNAEILSNPLYQDQKTNDANNQDAPTDSPNF